MKNTLLLITILFSFNAFGADRNPPLTPPRPSTTPFRFNPGRPFGFNPGGRPKARSLADRHAEYWRWMGLDRNATTPVSKTGLEGWGKDGINILSTDHSDVGPSFHPGKRNAFPPQLMPKPIMHPKWIVSAYERKLRQAGIKVVDKPTGHVILINIYPLPDDNAPDRLMIIADQIQWYSVHISAKRVMEFKALDNTGKLATYEVLASKGSYDGIAEGIKLIPFIEEIMDKLLLDHLKANPTRILWAEDE